MQFKVLVASFAAAALAANSTVTNGTNATATGSPTGAETANGASHIVQGGLIAAVVAGGAALML